MKIFDTSSIICLLRDAGFPKALDICIKRGYRVATTRQVYEEIQRNPETFAAFKAYGKFLIIPVDKDLVFTRLSRRYPWLHDGEISILCISLQKKQHREWYIAIVDERARKLKDTLHIRIHGTIGLLLWQKEHGELSTGECHDLYKKIGESSFRVPEDILARLVR